ncbi:MAG: hypothetical protein U0228_17545 [Myxococcaceae bacterium]
MAAGWSIDGKRLEFGPAFPAGKLVVKEGGATVHELKLASKGEWTLAVGGQQFQVTRVQKFMGPKTTLVDGRGARVPMTDKPVVPAPAAAGSQCATHQASARYACARCGAFVCPECAGSDLTHCRPCVERLLVEEDKNAAAMAYMAPVVVLGVFGGLLLAVLGALAGAGAVAIAKKVESTPLKVLAAAALYGVAIVLWVIIVAMIKS